MKEKKQNKVVCVEVNSKKCTFEKDYTKLLNQNIHSTRDFLHCIYRQEVPFLKSAWTNKFMWQIVLDEFVKSFISYLFSLNFKKLKKKCRKTTKNYGILT